MVGFDGSEMDRDYEEEERELAEVESTDYYGVCHRCEGARTVPLLLESSWESYDGEPVWGDRDCPDCGGSGRQRSPEELSELRYMYGPGWNE